MKAATIIAVLTFTVAHAAAVAEADPRNLVAPKAPAPVVQAPPDPPKPTYVYHTPIPWSSCGAPGVTCAKTKRAALAVAEALAEASPRHKRNAFSSCNAPGIACANARRSLEELGAATEKTLDNVFQLDKDDEAIAYRNKVISDDFPSTNKATKRDAQAWNYIPWSSCGPPGVTCAKAKRGAELIAEDFPNIHEDECFAAGGECHAVLKARAAFDEAVKREANAWNYIPWSSCGPPGVTCARDAEKHIQAKLAGDPAAEQAEKDCHGPDGDCTKAEGYFKELDAALTKATRDVLKEKKSRA